MNHHTRMILYVTAVLEVATGAALLIVPSIIGRLLFGEEFTGVAILPARVTGIALIALGVACWPGRPAFYGMLVYSTAATLYLAYVGFAGSFAGLLLWPVVVVHLILTLLLTRTLISGTETTT
jgi:hypothetical protein